MNKILTFIEARKALDPILTAALEYMADAAQRKADETGETAQLPLGSVLIEARPQQKEEE